MGEATAPNHLLSFTKNSPEGQANRKDCMPFTMPRGHEGFHVQFPRAGGLKGVERFLEPQFWLLQTSTAMDCSAVHTYLMNI
jgi:hypothetical protein